MKGLFLDDWRSSEVHESRDQLKNVEWLEVRSVDQFEKALQDHPEGFSHYSFDYFLGNFVETRHGKEAVQALIHAIVCDGYPVPDTQNLYFHSSDVVKNNMMREIWMRAVDQHDLKAGVRLK